MLHKSFFIFVCLLITLLCPCISSTFTVTNNCPFTIWPGTLSGSGTLPLSTTGFQLESGKTVRIDAVPGWSGRLWARTGCKFDQSGMGTCLTGDCGGKLECDGSGATPPASLFEITLSHGTDKDFYDVSLVDGYNLPLVAWPTGVSGCNATGCVSDINMGCPKELQVVGGDGAEGGVVACKSACETFRQDQYCCSGQFANPTTCKPSYYSTIFKRACPRAYSYAFDDGTSTFTCKAHNYAIVFCPTSAVGPKKPNGGMANRPPSSGTYLPPSGRNVSAPAGYSSPPSNQYSSPPSEVGSGSPLSDQYGSPPPSGFGSTPRDQYDSPPSGYVSPPNDQYSSPPSGIYGPPSAAYDTPPATVYDGPPSYVYQTPALGKHSYGASEGEISSSYPSMPCPAFILLIITLLLIH